METHCIAGLKSKAVKARKASCFPFTSQLHGLRCIPNMIMLHSISFSMSLNYTKHAFKVPSHLQAKLEKEISIPHRVGLIIFLINFLLNFYFSTLFLFLMSDYYFNLMF